MQIPSLFYLPYKMDLFLPCMHDVEVRHMPGTGPDFMYMVLRETGMDLPCSQETHI